MGYVPRPSPGGSGLLAKDKPLSGGTYNAILADMDGSILTDGAETGGTQVTIILPLLADAIVNGGIIRIASLREIDVGRIAVYPNGADNRTLMMGANLLFYSLYSTDVGYLELVPQSINGTNVWRVLGFSAFWRDDD